MKEPILESKPLAVAAAVSSGAISSTHLFGYQWESWILWMSFVLTALLLWGQLKLHVVRPLGAHIVAVRSWYAKRKRAKAAKRRRAGDR